MSDLIHISKVMQDAGILTNAQITEIVYDAFTRHCANRHNADFEVCPFGECECAFLLETQHDNQVRDQQALQRWNQNVRAWLR